VTQGVEKSAAFLVERQCSQKPPNNARRRRSKVSTGESAANPTARLAASYESFSRWSVAAAPKYRFLASRAEPTVTPQMRAAFSLSPPARRYLKRAEIGGELRAVQRRQGAANRKLEGFVMGGPVDRPGAG
jgi:hypothetical protein